MGIRSWLCGKAERRARKAARRAADEALFAGLLDQLCRSREAHGGARFLQIGANDGCTNDPLHPVIQRYRLEGICVEPLPEAFDLLRKTYSDHPNVRLIQRAIGSESGWMNLYVAGLPDGASEAERRDAYRKATFSKASAIAKTRKACGVDDRAAEEKLQIRQVETSTLPGLLADCGNPGIDILQIDAEGEDWRILRQLDGLPSLPPLVNLEHKGLDPEEREAMQRWLSRSGYLWFEHGRDTCALRIDWQGH
ncbi:MAG: FkbM family methyltransferase [Ectothiorhodospiraceae bacterium]|nr:FkbM family methyltransferase [Ectothiorhodospiraceae bacterium]